jgi:hypothetical protein
MKPQPKASTQEVLAGLIERVTYHNAENGFCVLRAHRPASVILQVSPPAECWRFRSRMILPAVPRRPPNVERSSGCSGRANGRMLELGVWTFSTTGGAPMGKNLCCVIRSTC